jgi:hypothetical protein
VAVTTTALLATDDVVTAMNTAANDGRLGRA